MTDSYALVASALIGALVISTLVTLTASYLLGYGVYRSLDLEYKTYAYGLMGISAATWLVLVIAGPVLLQQYKDGRNIYTGLLVVVVLSLLLFVAGLAISSLGWGKSQTTLTDLLRTPRTYFAVAAGLQILGAAWIVVLGAVALRMLGTGAAVAGRGARAGVAGGGQAQALEENIRKLQEQRAQVLAKERAEQEIAAAKKRLEDLQAGRGAYPAAPVGAYPAAPVGAVPLVVPRPAAAPRPYYAGGAPYAAFAY